jgi:hypothetical protein
LITRLITTSARVPSFSFYNRRKIHRLMQKLIDGKLYDTDEAKKIDSWSNGRSRSDFRYKKETLCVAEKGNWFLFGEGHAKTRYASTTGDGMRGFGKEIRALLEEEAFQWLQRRNKVKAAREHFPEYFEPA